MVGCEDCGKIDSFGRGVTALYHMSFGSLYRFSQEKHVWHGEWANRQLQEMRCGLRERESGGGRLY